MEGRRNAAFGFAASVALHGTALAAVLAFGSGWWGDARPVVGSAEPAVWPVVWIDEKPETPPQAQDVSEPQPDPVRVAATAEPAPPPAPTPEKPAPKPKAHASPPKTKPAPVADKGSAPAAAVESPAPKTTETAEAEKSEEADRSQPLSGDGTDVKGLELAALPPPAPAPSAVGWSVEARVPPIYPLSARRRGAEGQVVLRAMIGDDGTPTAVRVVRGSGHAELDAAARVAVEKWRFRAPAGSGVEIPIVFRLENR